MKGRLRIGIVSVGRSIFLGKGIMRSELLARRIGRMQVLRIRYRLRLSFIAIISIRLFIG
jgi:hypothetical protein